MGQYDIRVGDSGIAIIGKLVDYLGGTINATGTTADVTFRLFAPPDYACATKTGEIFVDSDGISKTRFYLTGDETPTEGIYKIQVSLFLGASGFRGATNEGTLRVARKICN